MKKLLYAAIAAIGLLLSPACSNEDELSNEALISFNVGVENGMQTKTIADGSTATVLRVRVFEDGTTEGTIKELTAFQQDFTDFNGTKDNIEFSLLKGKNYYFLFWAEANQTTSPYKINNNGTITVSYDNAFCNDEKRDAFVGVYSCVAQTTINQSITLKRPFAQLNFLTTEKDIQAAAAGKIVADPIAGLQTQVVINKAANTLNPFTGEISGEVRNITFKHAAVPFTISNSTSNLTADYYTVTATNGTFNVGGEERHYLATNYFLTKEVADVEATMTVKDAQGEGLTVPSIPVNKNYRTNIYGDLLTKPGQFSVSISAGFDDPDNPDYNKEYENTLVQTPVIVDNITDLENCLADRRYSSIAIGQDFPQHDLAQLTIDRHVVIDGRSLSIGKVAFTVTTDEGVEIRDTKIETVGSYAITATNLAGKLTVMGCIFTTTAAGLNITTAESGAKITVENCHFLGPDSKETNQYLKIAAANGVSATDATLRIVNNTFEGANFLGEVVDSEGAKIMTFGNLSATNTTIGYNSISPEGPTYSEKISVSFHDTKTNITSSQFVNAFIGQENKIVSEIK